MRIAVTGASGFCGAAVARAAGADTICLGRRPGPLGRHVPWDAATEHPDLSGADAVIHLAAAVGDPGDGPGTESAFRAVNVDGAERLLDAAGDRPVVWVSSASVYRPGGGVYTEDHPVDGQLNAYGRTKAEGEALALKAGAVVLRPRAVYGPGDPHLLPRLRRASRAGITPLPGPDTMLSLTAVSNLADACLAALDWPAGAYNIADGHPYPRDAAIRAVLTAAGLPARIAHVPVPLANGAARLGIGGLSRYAVEQLASGVVLDIAKARGRGWSPRFSLTDYLAVLCAS